MDKFEIQRRVFRINAVLVFVSALAMAAIIPKLVQEISPDGIPSAAAIATSVGVLIHLLFSLGFYIGMKLAKRKRRINKEINIAAAVCLGLIALIISDGGFAYLNDWLWVALCIFTAVACDFAAVVVSIVAVVLLMKKKKKQHG